MKRAELLIERIMMITTRMRNLHTVEERSDDYKRGVRASKPIDSIGLIMHGAHWLKNAVPYFHLRLLDGIEIEAHWKVRIPGCQGYVISAAVVTLFLILVSIQHRHPLTWKGQIFA